MKQKEQQIQQRIMPSYCHDYTHCSQDRCPLKDKCYRYWLGKEIKNTDFQYASLYMPSPDEELGDKCEYFVDLKEFVEQLKK